MDKKKESLGAIITRIILSPLRTNQSKSKEIKIATDLYNAVWGFHVDTVKIALEHGADPNYCYGESGWIDSNPLNVLAGGFYDTYYLRDSIISSSVPDVDILNLLVKAGADINRRPYIWYKVYINNNDDFIRIKKQREFNGEPIDNKSMKEQIDNFINDTNRLLEAFLKNGASVDKKGDPYPFSSEAMHTHITEMQANEYFSRGTRAINEAIKKGIVWESQVDLLLKYTKLDENSLVAARQSKDQKMIDKIEKLWKKQMSADNTRGSDPTQ